MSFYGQYTGFGGGVSGYVTHGAVFDGSNDYMLRGAAYTSIADSARMTVSFWFRLASGSDGAHMYILSQGDALYTVARLQVTNKIRIDMFNTGASRHFQVEAATAYTSGATWRHFLFSADTNFSAGNKVAHVYITDVEDKNITIDAAAAFDIDFTSTEEVVGASTTPGQWFNGELADVYFNPGTFLDFSVEANRRKFIGADGKPVDLGSDGSTPTGTAPIAFFRIASGGLATDFATNQGSGGNMTITGALALSATNPSD